jgi:hypothetical protein
MQFATRRQRTLGWLAAALLAVAPSAAAAAAATGDDASADLHVVHVVEAGDTLNRLAIAYREAAGWFSQADCLAAIRRANGLPDGDRLNLGQRIMIPRWREVAPPRPDRPTRDGSGLRGIYLPGPVCGYQSVFARIDSFTVRGGNGVVFDAKDIDGALSYRSALPLAAPGPGRTPAVIADLPDLVRRLHARDLWTVARLALFLDGELGRLRPDLVLRGPAGEPWTERDCVWLDPAAPAVRDHFLGLAVELARAGVDEVQIDYVRYPTNGWRGDWQGDLETTAARRRAVITSFVAALHDTLQALGCVLSADLFGIMAWDRTEDLALTGQHVPSLAGHLDVICPMIYPSHFAPGFEGLERPGDHPEYLIAEGVRRFRAQAGPRVLIRPWLQAFPWRASAYGAAYVRVQIEAAAAAGAAGWCLWNPAGRYEAIQAALDAPVAAPVAVLAVPVRPPLAAAAFLPGP